MWFLTNAKWSHDRNLTKGMRLKGWSKFIPPSLPPLLSLPPLQPLPLPTARALSWVILYKENTAPLCEWLCCGSNPTCCGAGVIWCEVYIRHLKVLLLHVQVFSKSLEPKNIQQLIHQTASLLRCVYKLGLNITVPGFPQLPVILPSVFTVMSN